MKIPIEEQANVSGGLMSLDPGTVPGQRPPNFGKKEYQRLPPADPVYDPYRPDRHLNKDRRHPQIIVDNE